MRDALATQIVDRLMNINQTLADIQSVLHNIQAALENLQEQKQGD
jgi:hypothetical protein